MDTEPQGLFSPSVDAELIRNRRLNSSSDEQIENDIDSRLAFRKGWPTLAPLPLQTLWQPDPYVYFPDRETHFRHIQILLRVQQVRPTAIHVVYRVPYGLATRDLSTATLLVTTEPDSGNLFMAVRHIRKYLAAHNIHVCVEIIDERGMIPKTFAILPSDHDTINHWNTTLRDPVVQYLNSTGLKWTSINVLHRGLNATRENCPRTVVVSAGDATDKKWWSEALPYLRELCRPALLVELVAFDEHVDNVDGYGDAQDAARRLRMQDFNINITPGANCGPANTLSRRTLGGAVRLRARDGRAVGTFAISNHHGIGLGSLGNAVTARSAITPSNYLVGSRSLSIRSPSDRDFGLKLKTIEARLGTFRATINGTPHSLGLRAKVEMGDDTKRQALDEKVANLANIQSEQRFMTSFDRSLGYIYASSGYRTSSWGDAKEWALDWSLTSIKSPRTVQSVVDKTPAQEEVGINGMKNQWRKASPAGLRVAKHGCSSAWTVGQVNDIETIFSSTGHYEKPVRGWAAIPETQLNHFSFAGDSGAVVIDADETSATCGCWVGLLFAFNMGMSVGYFMPIQMVFEDITAITDCEISEPTPSPLE